MIRALTVFLCSTQADLRPERDAILAAVRRLQLQHDSMEFFGARESRPLEICLAEVRRSDILVVIIGHRYGSVVPGQQISYTEAEYQEGHRLGKPCLVYMRDDDVPILPRHMERDADGMQALDRLKDTLRERHTVASFRAPDDLAVGVTADLARTIQDLDEAARLEQERAALPRRPILEEIGGIVDAATEKGASNAAIVAEIRRALDSLTRAAGRRETVVFLSYTHSDSERVRPFAAALRSQGISLWIDEEQVAPGQSLIETITSGLQSADCLAFFMSGASLKSRWVRQELSVVMAQRLSAQAKGPLFIPILLDDVEVPSLLRDVKFIDLRSGDITGAAAAFVNALARHIAPPPTLGMPADNRHVVEKSIHALRALLHVRSAYSADPAEPGSGRRSLDHAIEDLAKAVGGLCGLSTKPENKLQLFVSRVLAATKGDDLPAIFQEIPELRRFVVMPYFDMGDGAKSWVKWDISAT